MQNSRTVAHFHSLHDGDFLLEQPSSLLFDGQIWKTPYFESPVGSFGRHPVLSPKQIEEARLLLEASTPLFSRWWPDASEHQLRLDHSLVVIGRIVGDMLDLGLRAIIFHSSAPHHPRQFLVQIASQLASLKTIYLHLDVISGRLVPIFLSLPEANFKPLLGTFSNYGSSAAIAEFGARASSQLAPKLNPVGKISETWLMSAVLTFALNSARFFVRNAILLGKSILERGGVVRPVVSLPPNDSFRFWDELRVSLRQRSAIIELKRLTKLFKVEHLSRPHIFLYAHLEPEATVFPLAGSRFKSQLALILHLRAIGYNNPILWKEHPNSSFLKSGREPSRVGVSRSKQFYRLLSELDVHFPPPGLSPSEEMSVVMTIRGSIAVERSLGGLPTVVCANPFPCWLPGMVELGADTQFVQKYRTIAENPIDSSACAQILGKVLGPNTIGNPGRIGLARSVASSVPGLKSDFLSEIDNLVNFVVTKK